MKKTEVKNVLKNQNKAKYDLINQPSTSMKQFKNHKVEGEQRNMLNNTRRMQPVKASHAENPTQQMTKWQGGKKVT